MRFQLIHDVNKTIVTLDGLIGKQDGLLKPNESIRRLERCQFGMSAFFAAHIYQENAGLVFAFVIRPKKKRAPKVGARFFIGFDISDLKVA